MTTAQAIQRSPVQSVPEQPNAGPAEALSFWVEAFNAQDLPRICGLYAHDAVLWGTFSPSLIVSPEGIREYFVRAFDPLMQASAELQEFRLQSLGSVSVASGAYLLRATMAGHRRLLPARFTIVLGQSQGAWKIFTHHSSLTPG
jgi:ketosteroid isomerase-like protein